MEFYIVDAFSREIFGGNPAGVILLPNNKDFPSKKHMIMTAAELRYSETVFVKKLGEKQYQMRYFTPTDEVDLCGHGTLASFYSLIHKGEVKEDTNYSIDTLAGSLNINCMGEVIWLEMGKPTIIDTITDLQMLKKLNQVLGIDLSKNTSMAPAIVSTGLPDILFPVETLEQLNNIRPDYPQLASLSKDLNVTGIHSFFIDQKEGVIHCRNFAPLYGIPEEAATGTSNGALTYYLYTKGILKEEMINKFIQGEIMGRKSEIKSYISKKTPSETVIKIGGSCKILAQGIINI